MNTAAIEIARLAVTRMLRERSNLFFVFAFPLLLVLLIGLSFGGEGGGRVTVVGTDPATEILVAHLEAAELNVLRSDDLDIATEDLGRGRTDALVALPDDFSQALADATTSRVQVGLRPQAQALRPAIEAALAQLQRPARVAALARSLGVEGAVPPAFVDRAPVVTIQRVVQGVDNDELGDLTAFDLGASTQLVLFVFITTLGGATRIVEARDLGTLRRMLAGPTSAGDVILGEGLGRFAVGLFQALWIVLATMVIFGVDWGNPFAASVVVVALTAASAGAGLFLGAWSRTVSQASGLSTFLGLTLAALGGSMAPLDIFSPTLRRIAHVTPHAWANDAFAELTRRGGGLGDVLTEVAVLLGFAVILGGLAARRLRTSLTAG